MKLQISSVDAWSAGVLEAGRKHLERLVRRVVKRPVSISAKARIGDKADRMSGGVGHSGTARRSTILTKARRPFVEKRYISVTVQKRRKIEFCRRLGAAKGDL